MKIYPYLSVLILCCLLSCKKSKGVSLASRQNDSLNVYFEKANNDSLPVKVRYNYAKKAENIVLKGENDSMHRVNLFKVANRYWNMNDLRESKDILDELLSLSIYSKDTTALTKTYNYFSEYYTRTMSIDSAYIYINMAEDLYIKQRKKNILNYSQTLLNKAILQFRVGDLPGCEKTAINALIYLRNSNEYQVIFEMNNILGLIYNELQDYNKSLFFHRKALYIANENKIDINYHANEVTLNNIGYVYRCMGNYKETIKCCKQALLDPNILTNKPDLYATLQDNLAYAEFKINDFHRLPKLFFQSLKIREKLKVIPGTIASMLNLSEYYAFKKDTVKAVLFAKKAYDIAKYNRLSKDLLLCINQLSIVDVPKSKKYLKEYITVNNSLQLQERRNSNKFARIEYETEELALENNNLIDQRKTILYISSSILLILVVTLLFWYQRSKNRELKFLREQQLANEEIYRLMLDQHQKLEEGKQFEKARIAKELHDGIMGRLSSIRLNLFALEKKTDETTIAKCIGYIHEIQDVEKEIKSIAYDLGNDLFSENISFETMVRKLFAAIESHSDINFRLFIDPKLDWETVNNNCKIQIYRILQEALQNIDKYANANHVIVSIKKPDNAIEIEITDDGVGFDKKNVKKGFGLKNMKVRAKEINGKLAIKSEKGKGTSIILIVAPQL